MSYIGKNPKVDSVKLEGSATAASGTEEGQLYYNTGTGSISKGLKVFKNSQFVAIDKQLGDADTFHLLKAADISTAEWSAARNSTSTSFLNQNAVPFETTTASGAAGTFSNSSTGDALLTDESADLVFAYKSSGTSDDAQEYFGIPLSIPKAFRGGNIVLSFEYRTGFGTGTTATVDGDFEVAVLDKSTGNGGQTTTTNTSGTAIAAGSAITVASKTGLAVGQRIRLETGSSTIAAGSPDATVTEAFITSVSSTANEITISESYAPPSTSGGVVVSGWLTDVIPGQLKAADSQTDKKGKKFSIQFKTEDDTSDIVLFFQNKNTSSTISRHLFVDNILFSANKFLQASSQVKSEYYFASGNSNFWNDLSSNSGWDADLVVSGFGAPPVSQSKFLRFEETSTTDTRVYAKQDIDLAVSFTGHAQAGNQIKIYNSSGEILAQQQTPEPAGHVQNNSVFVSIALAKDDYMYCVNDRGSTASNRYGAASFLASGRNSDVIILESQDEIFTDWNDYTPTLSGSNSPGNISFKWRRVGSEMEIRGIFELGSTTNSDPATFSLPSGYALDITDLTGSISSFGDYQYIDDNFYITDNSRSGVLVYDGTNTDRLHFAFIVTSGGIYNLQNGTSSFGSGGSRFVTLNAKFPVQGFNANFNPLLSMPLVDFGTFSNTYTARFDGGATTSDSTRLLSESEPFVKTVVEDPGDGRYTITFLDGFFTQTPAVAACVENAENSDKVINVHSVTSALCKVSIESSGDQLPSAANFNIIVTRQGSDFKPLPQPTAAVIKPAVAFGRIRHTNGTNGGTSTGGAYSQRTFNTWDGETWFVSGFDGTLGANGTTDQFDLDPGTYKVQGHTTAYKSNGSFSKMESTDSSVLLFGTNGRPGNGEDVNVLLPFEGSFTITEKKTFKIFTWVATSNTTYGLGVEIGTSTSAPSEREEQYGVIRIEKLK